MKLTAIQRNQGNPRITDWCPRCQARVIPVGEGYCGWCDTPITGQALRTRKEYDRKIREATKVRTRALAAAKTGTISVPELADMLGVPTRTARYTIDSLRRAGVIESAGRDCNTGRPRNLYRLKDTP